MENDIKITKLVLLASIGRGYGKILFMNEHNTDDPLQIQASMCGLNTRNQTIFDSAYIIRAKQQIMITSVITGANQNTTIIQNISDSQPQRQPCSLGDLY